MLMTLVFSLAYACLMLMLVLCLCPNETQPLDFKGMGCPKGDNNSQNPLQTNWKKEMAEI